MTETQLRGDRAQSARRTRLSRVALLAALALGVAFILESAWPRSHRVDVHLPDRDGGVTALDVEVSQGGEVLRAFHRGFAGEAPERVRLDVNVADGRYDFLLRTEARAGSVLERTVRVTLEGDVVRAIEAR